MHCRPAVSLQGANKPATPAERLIRDALESCFLLGLDESRRNAGPWLPARVAATGATEDTRRHASGARPPAPAPNGGRGNAMDRRLHMPMNRAQRTRFQRHGKSVPTTGPQRALIVAAIGAGNTCARHQISAEHSGARARASHLPARNVGRPPNVDRSGQVQPRPAYRNGTLPWPIGPQGHLTRKLWRGAGHRGCRGRRATLLGPHVGVIASNTFMAYTCQGGSGGAPI